MYQECGGLNWWITTATDSGKWLHANYPQAYFPKDHRRSYAQNICAHLNLHANYGGAWLVGWAIDAKKLIYIWKDQEGDIQLIGDCERPWWVIREWPLTGWENQAHAAYAQWYEHMEVLDRKNDQKVNLARINPNPKTKVKNNFKH